MTDRLIVDIPLPGMPETETYDPPRHYGHNPSRPDYTPCGKWPRDVVVTFDAERVTCNVCVEELRLAGVAAGAHRG